MMKIMSLVCAAVPAMGLQMYGQQPQQGGLYRTQAQVAGVLVGQHPSYFTQAVPQQQYAQQGYPQPQRQQQQQAPVQAPQGGGLYRTLNSAQIQAEMQRIAVEHAQYQQAIANAQAQGQLVNSDWTQRVQALAQEHARYAAMLR